MTAIIIKFSGLIAPCSKCRRRFKKKLVDNDPAFCDYECGAKAQPKYTIVNLEYATEGRRS